MSKNLNFILSAAFLLTSTYATGARAHPSSGHKAPEQSHSPSKYPVANVGAFDIGGFKLGMTASDVAAVLRDRYPDHAYSDYAIETTACEGPDNDYKSEGLKVDNKDVNVEMNFAKDFRSPDAQCRVYQIALTQKGDFMLDRDVPVLRSKVVSKYGTPSYSDDRAYAWCNRITKYDFMAPSVNICDQDAPFATIFVSDTGAAYVVRLTATDWSLFAPIRDAWVLKQHPAPALNF